MSFGSGFLRECVTKFAVWLPAVEVLDDSMILRFLKSFDAEKLQESFSFLARELRRDVKVFGIRFSLNFSSHRRANAGLSDLTDEHLVRTDESVRRHAEHSWSEENLRAVVATPQRPKTTIAENPTCRTPRSSS